MFLHEEKVFDDGLKIKIFNGRENFKSCLLFAPANAVPMVFYQPLAEWIAKNNNIKVVMLDYLGVGESTPTHPKKIVRSASAWARKDIKNVIDYISEELEVETINYLGHSIGGQLVGLIPNVNKIDKIILVASQSAYFGFWKGFSKLKMMANWYVLIPLMVKLYGYLPGKFSSMEDLPPDAALEWARWARSENYFMDHQNEVYFNEITSSVVSISFSDDNYAPLDSVEWLAKRFENATVERIHYRPEDLKKDKIGHFGLFKKKNKDLWPIISGHLKLI
ncbi:alpha/beta fold hydrolase [Mangrovivirga sp. M17]|uniref:Alpha/beta fold hydrolase n=1 Tax=Mangrovivirga halotolerans TaxID=2993936 RepID=A0ABT3RN10_9BACT|nr:alpha/beta fold hydrolase [Mangrovivirga halotolerans]MCX2742981.1 alpha/beta fold hydrolase [Mangrovivirga halotolerans]